MKFKLLPVPHIIIYNLQITDNEKGITLENHYFLTRRGAKKLIQKRSKQLEKENCSCGFGGEPLWFW